MHHCGSVNYSELLQSNTTQQPGLHTDCSDCASLWNHFWNFLGNFKKIKQITCNLWENLPKSTCLTSRFTCTWLSGSGIGRCLPVCICICMFLYVYMYLYPSHSDSLSHSLSVSHRWTMSGLLWQFGEMCAKVRACIHTWWHHDMEMLSASLALCEGKWPVTGDKMNIIAVDFLAPVDARTSATITLFISPPTGIILCMRPANERCHYNVMSSLIGCAHSQNDPCLGYMYFNNLWSFSV